MIKLGLCGEIASGKSEAEKIFKNMGFLTVDLDDISHWLLEKNSLVQKEVLKEFNTLDRKEIARIVFDSEIRRKDLENIIHPRLKDYIFDLFEKNKEKNILVSGALLFEAGFNRFFDKTIFISAQKDIRLKRLTERNNLDEIEALKRINAQNDDAKLKADFIIENNGKIKDLEEKIKELNKNLRIE